MDPVLCASSCIAVLIKSAQLGTKVALLPMLINFQISHDSSP